MNPLDQILSIVLVNSAPFYWYPRSRPSRLSPRPRVARRLEFGTADGKESDGQVGKSLKYNR